MTREEAKEVFLNRGFVDGIYDGDKWREACIVISEWLDQEPKTGHWVDREIYDADRWRCSECGRTEQYKENYCPNCGCAMKGELG